MKTIRRYTRDLRGNYQLTVPRKVTAKGRFISYSLPHYFEHHSYHCTENTENDDDNSRGSGDCSTGRKKRSAYAEDAAQDAAGPQWDPLYYEVTLHGVVLRLQLQPNRGFVAPHLVFESRVGPDVAFNEPEDSPQRLRRLSGPLCHYTGWVLGDEGSRVALSTCDGLAGYLMTNGRRYFIEPVWSHVPNEKDQLTHVVYEREDEPVRAGINERPERQLTKEEQSEDRTTRCATTEKWEDAWERRFYTEFSSGAGRGKKRNVTDGSNHTTGGVGDRSGRGIQSGQRYLETLVVADKQFLNYHKNTDYQTYILTIMNMVSDFFHDASIGNRMDVVVVRVMYLEKEEKEIDLVINGDAEATLASFCKWQHTINPKDISNPNHHDIAILLTRHDICMGNGTAGCGLMGLAYMASACTGDHPCSINEDSGLLLGVVVAHEIGHVLGSSHDTEQESGCNPDEPDDSSHVMSPNDLGECLNDEPQVSLYHETDMLPGAMYDADYQCDTQFPRTKACRIDSQQFCKQLFCKTAPHMCSTFGDPPADGTKCGENMSQFGGCSRICGGGIQVSRRDCDNPAPKHNGRYCIGENKRVRICNTNLCNLTANSFRAQQCSEYNSEPFLDKLYEWEPYIQSDDPCTLYCINADRIYTKMAPRAKDGTKCKPGTKNMCVFGVCRKVGCDWELDSDAMEDQCGICKGDGTQCSVVDEIFDDPVTKGGYVKVTTVSKGSSNLVFDELKPSQSMIAVSSVQDVFYLNGDFTEQLDGNVNIGEDVGVYTHTEPNKEMLLIHGPLKADIILLVCFVERVNVGYRYRYVEPSTEIEYHPQYHWEAVGWGDCSTRCGGGIKTALVECIEEISGRVSQEFCDGVEKLESWNKKCKEQPCRTKWRVGRWSRCLACQRHSGIRLRAVECVRENPIAGEDDILVEDIECKRIKPGTKQLCNADRKCRERRAKVKRPTLAGNGTLKEKRKDEEGRFRRRSRHYARDYEAAEDLHLHDNLMQQLWQQTVGWERARAENEPENEDIATASQDKARYFTANRPKVGVSISEDESSRKDKQNKVKNVVSNENDEEEEETDDSSVDDRVGEGENDKEDEEIAKITEPPFHWDSIVEDKRFNDPIKPIHQRHHLKSQAIMAKPIASKDKTRVNDRPKGGASNAHSKCATGGKHGSVKSVARKEKDEEEEESDDGSVDNGSGGPVAVGKEDEAMAKMTVPPFHVGSIVLDKMPDDRIKVIEQPLKQSHLALNLSDTAFEQLGDKVPDSLDKEHQIVYTGKKASAVLAVLQRIGTSNTSAELSDD